MEGFLDGTQIWVTLSERTFNLFMDVWSAFPKFGQGYQQCIEKNLISVKEVNTPGELKLRKGEGHEVIGVCEFFPSGQCQIILDVAEYTDKQAKHTIAHELFHACFDSAEDINNNADGLTADDRDDLADEAADELGFPAE